jgi:hypothetical protein
MGVGIMDGGCKHVLLVKIGTTRRLGVGLFGSEVKRLETKTEAKI